MSDVDALLGMRRGPARAGGGGASFRWLLRRELVRFGRQRSRVIAALGTPLMIWLVLASGFAGSGGGPGGVTDGAGYGAYLVPGMAVMVVLFTSIFAAISLIEDRHAGFLQSVLVSPAPRWALVGSKVAAVSLVSLAQAVVILVAAPLTGVALTPMGVALGLAALLSISVGLSGLGLALAWQVDSVQGFHGVMNLVLMPMWLLSGAFFALEGASTWLRAVMSLNPLTWPSEALRWALLGESGLPLPLAWAGAGTFAAVGMVLPMVVMQRPVRQG
ncbi:MAG: ABC transporter permease [Phycisphaerales bacterium]|nr:ABC transporter permease [Phycisphaerales bacterium]